MYKVKMIGKIKSKRLSRGFAKKNIIEKEKVKLVEFVKGAVSRNSAKLGNYKMPVKLRET